MLIKKRKPLENIGAARKLKINKWSYYKLKKRPMNVDFGQQQSTDEA